MEARSVRAALLAALLLVTMGASHRTPNFIVQTREPKLARSIGEAAEKYRRQLAIAWLGHTMPNWSQPCVMAVRVAPNLGAGGATTFMFDRGEVFGWRMTIQGSAERIFDSVLPHEITHMIFASHFRRPVPRWADEGAATSVEHSTERTRHRRMLLTFLKTGRGIALNRMFAMREYPGDVMPLYAQGFSLAEFLIQQGGRRKYVEYLADGMKDNQWSAATQRHYGIKDLGVLQATWLAWVRQGFPTIPPRDLKPGSRPAAQMLAGGGKPPRPEPNLIYRLPKERRAPDTQAVVSCPAGSSGWHAAGTGPDRSAAAQAAQPASHQPIHSQLTRPQPIERSRQRVLEWSRPAVSRSRYGDQPGATKWR